MNDATRHQVKKFITDPTMSSAVYEQLRSFFLKRKKTDDVQMLAAERLTLFLLEDAWKDLERVGEVKEEKEPVRQVGL